MYKKINLIMLIGLSPFLLFVVSHYIIPSTVAEKKMPGILLKNYHQKISNDTKIISDSKSVGAVCWYLKRNDVYLLKEGGELDYGLRYPDALGRILDLNTADDLIKRNNGKILVIAETKNILNWQGQLPKPRFKDSSGSEGYSLWLY